MIRYHCWLWVDNTVMPMFDTANKAAADIFLLFLMAEDTIGGCVTLTTL